MGVTSFLHSCRQLSRPQFAIPRIHKRPTQPFISVNTGFSYNLMLYAIVIVPFIRACNFACPAVCFTPYIPIIHERPIYVLLIMYPRQRKLCQIYPVLRNRHTSRPVEIYPAACQKARTASFFAPARENTGVARPYTGES